MSNYLTPAQRADDERIAELAKQHEAQRREQGVERLQPAAVPGGNADELHAVGEAVDARFTGRYQTRYEGPLVHNADIIGTSPFRPDKAYRIYRSTLHSASGPVVFSYVDTETGKPMAHFHNGTLRLA